MLKILKKWFGKKSTYMPFQPKYHFFTHDSVANRIMPPMPWPTMIDLAAPIFALDQNSENQIALFIEHNIATLQIITRNPISDVIKEEINNNRPCGVLITYAN